MLLFPFDPFPTLTTERLVLRQPAATDVRALYALRTDEKVNAYIERGIPDSLQEVRVIIRWLDDGIREKRWMYWAIARKNDPRLIGTICLWNIHAEKMAAEVGYELLPRCQGQGIMREALSAVLDFGFQAMNLEKIHAWTHENNAPSAKLLERHRFSRDPAAERNADAETAAKRLVAYTLLRGEHAP